MRKALGGFVVVLSLVIASVVPASAQTAPTPPPVRFVCINSKSQVFQANALADCNGGDTALAIPQFRPLYLCADLKFGTLTRAASANGCNPKFAQEFTIPDVGPLFVCSADRQSGVVSPTGQLRKVDDPDQCDLRKETAFVTPSAPVAKDDTFTTDEDTVLDVPAAGVLANDDDIDQNPLTARLVPADQPGITFNSDGSFRVDPRAQFNSLAAGQTGTLHFTYVASDGVLDSQPATLTVKISGVDDQPVGAPDGFAVAEGSVLTVAAPGVLGNDSDAEGEPLAAHLISGPTAAGFPSAGTVDLNQDGSFVYQQHGAFSSLADGEQATVRFTYQVSDPTATGNTVSVAIVINGSNNPPSAVDDSYATDAITPLHISAPGVLGNDTDAEGQALTARAVANSSSPPGVFTLAADGSLDFDPRIAFAGLGTGQQAAATLNYQAVDSQGGTSTPGTITVHVAGLSAPTAVDDSRSTDEDTAIDIDPATNDVTQGGSITSVDTSGTRGSVTGPDSRGVIHYDPAGAFDTLQVGQHATDTFTYTVTNGRGSSTATVRIDISGVNDPPVGIAHTYSVSESQPLTVPAPGVLDGATDAEGDPLTAHLVAPPAKGRLSLQPDGSFEYDPAGELSAGDTETVTFQYLVSDGRAESAARTVTIVVSGANNPPVVTPGQTASVLENSPVGTAVLTLDYTDPDAGQTHSFAIVGGDPGGQFAIDSSGQITVAKPGLDAGTTPSYSLTVRVSDNAGGSGTGTVLITVTDVNDPPVAGPAQYSTIGNTELDAGGATPASAAHLTDSLNLLAGATDDGPAAGLSIIPASGATAAGGTFSVAADGSFVYQPPPAVTGLTDTFGYDLSDGTNAVPATASITISGMVWYVDGTATAPGDGTSITPYRDTAAFDGNLPRPDVAGDTIFVFDNASPYAGPIALRNDEQLIGQGADLVVDGTVVMHHGAAPAISFDAAGGISLAQDNTVQGLTLTGADASALSGTQVGKLVLGVGTIDVAGGAALDLTDGTVSGTVGPITANDSPADVVRLNQLGGNLNLAAGSDPAAVSATNTAGSLVHVNAPTALTVTGAVLDLHGTAGNGLEVTANAGSLSVPSGAINDANDTGILVDGGTGNFTTAAGVTAETGHSVQIRNLAAPAKATLTGPIYDHGTGVVLDGNAPGTAIALSGALDLSTGTNDAFSATYTGSAGDPQGGSVTVTGTGNTAVTTTGVAVKDVNVPIGTAGITFQSVSAAGAVNGILLRNTGVDPAVFGGLHVTGTATANSGGAIANATTGVLIDSGQATLAKLRVSRSTANGIELTDAKNVTLSGVTVEDSAGDGVHGDSVTNLIVNNQSLIQRSNGSAIAVTNLLGTSSVQGTSLAASFGGPQIDVHNNTASSPGPDVLQMTGVSFSNTPGVGVSAVADAGANLRLEVGSSAPSPIVSLADGSTGVSGRAINGGDLDVQVTKLLRSFGTGDAVALDASGTGSTLRFDVFDNTSANGGGFRNPGDAGVRLSAEHGATLSGSVSGNEIVDPSGDGVDESAVSGAHISADIVSNQITGPGCLVGTTDNCGDTANETDCPALVPPTVPPNPPIAPAVAVGVAVSVGDPAAGDSDGVVAGTIGSNEVTDPLTAGLSVDVSSGNTGTLNVSGNRITQTFNCAMGYNAAYGSAAAPLPGIPVPSPIRLTNAGGTLTVTGGVNTVTLTKSLDNAISVDTTGGGTSSISLSGDHTTNGYGGIDVTATGGSAVGFAEANAAISSPAGNGVTLEADNATLNPSVTGSTVTGAGGYGIVALATDSGKIVNPANTSEDRAQDPSISNNTVSSPRAGGIADEADPNSSLRLQIDGNAVDQPDSTNAYPPIQSYAAGGALTMSGGHNTVTLADASTTDGISVTADGGGAAELNTVGDSVSGGARGIAVSVSHGANMTADVLQFSRTGGSSDAVSIEATDTGTPGDTVTPSDTDSALSYDVEDAHITTPGGDGIHIAATGYVARASGVVAGNRVSGAGGDGIHLDGAQVATVIDNQVSGSVGGYGIDLAAGGAPSVCVDLAGNSSQVDPRFGYLIDDASGVPYGLPGYTGGSVAQWATDNGNVGSLITSGSNFRGPSCA